MYRQGHTASTRGLVADPSPVVLSSPPFPQRKEYPCLRSQEMASEVAAAPGAGGSRAGSNNRQPDSSLFGTIVRVFVSYAVMSIILAFVKPRAPPGAGLGGQGLGGDDMLALEQLAVKPIMRQGDLIVRALRRQGQAGPTPWMRHPCTPTLP
jgi:hypothetical protein